MTDRVLSELAPKSEEEVDRFIEMEKVLARAEHLAGLYEKKFSRKRKRNQKKQKKANKPKRKTSKRTILFNILFMLAWIIVGAIFLYT